MSLIYASLEVFSILKSVRTYRKEHRFLCLKSTKIIGDRLFVADIETSARLHSAAVKSDVYSYTFEYRGTVSKSNARTKSNVNIGVSHGDDTIYICKTELDNLQTDKDKQMSKVLLDMVISFMQNRKPNITTIWQPVKKSPDGPYVQLKILGPTDLELEFKNEIGHRSFWNSLPFNENANLYKNKRDEL